MSSIFDNIAYLQQGNSRQRHAYAILSDYQILSKLQPFDPILVGTIPINIDVESSDLDIIGCFSDKHAFQQSIRDHFGSERHFSMRERQKSGTLAIIANFIVDNFDIEIFGQNIPTKQQLAYRHLIVEDNLLKQHGEKLRQQIIELKRQGHKTEPAFGLALGLVGDPYIELLKFERGT
ncbi:MAG: DUF4269 domain-containing protein [Spirosomataceae bacterium]